jgi:hypothetical protein
MLLIMLLSRFRRVVSYLTPTREPIALVAKVIGVIVYGVSISYVLRSSNIVPPLYSKAPFLYLSITNTL